jgi:hypothetical protein
MPLTAIRHVRKMRGGAQAHLLEADDGHWYVVKFRNNPQHRRVLVNEALASTILSYLKICVPETALIEATPQWIAANPELHIQVGSRRVEVEPGWQFGSRFPGDPAVLAVYDFLPDALLSQVVNLQDFRAILVFDKWTANADGRQSIFHRAMIRGADRAAGRPGFVARMIDHGYSFNGPHWDFPESVAQGLYARRVVYDSVRSLDDFEPWLSLVAHFPEEIIDRAWRNIPPEWVEGEEDSLERLLEQLFVRRKRVGDLILASRQARMNPFTNWR